MTTEKKRLKRKYIIFLIVYFTFILLYVSVSAFSKYIGNLNKQDGSYTVAKPIIVIDVDPLTDKVNPVNSIEIDFSVLNYDGDDVNEVVLKYTISLINDNVSVPLQYTLYDANDNVLALNNLTTTSEFNMAASTKQKHDYKLVVSWNGSNSYSYQSLTKNIRIQANIKQLQI